MDPIMEMWSSIINYGNPSSYEFVAFGTPSAPYFVVKLFICLSKSNKCTHMAHIYTVRRWTGSALIQIMAVACSAPSHYLNQCWLIIIWTLRNNRQWKSNRNTKLFIHENAFEYITSAKWWPFCPGGDQLIWENIPCYNGTILWLIWHCEIH